MKGVYAIINGGPKNPIKILNNKFLNDFDGDLYNPMRIGKLIKVK